MHRRHTSRSFAYVRIISSLIDQALDMANDYANDATAYELDDDDQPDCLHITQELEKQLASLRADLDDYQTRARFGDGLFGDRTFLDDVNQAEIDIKNKKDFDSDAWCEANEPLDVSYAWSDQDFKYQQGGD